MPVSAGELRPGIIVRGPVFPEPVEILVVQPMGADVRLTGAGKSTGRVHHRGLTLAQLALLEAAPEHEPFDGDALRFRLGVEAMRLALAYEYDPYFSLSVARVDPLPHQLEAVYDNFTDVRFIEVKGRAGVGEIALTANEYKTAERLKHDYWLYVVFDCGTKPALHAIRDPVRLGWKAVVQVAHYHVDAKVILSEDSPT